jgi:hypothetical protein
MLVTIHGDNFIFGFSKLFQSVAWFAFFIRVDYNCKSPINFWCPIPYFYELLSRIHRHVNGSAKQAQKKNYIVQFRFSLIILFVFYTIVWLEYDSNMSVVSFSFFLFAMIPTYLFFLKKFAQAYL